MKCKGQKQFQLMNLTQLAAQNIQILWILAIIDNY